MAEMNHADFARTGFDMFVITYRTFDAPTVVMVSRDHIAADLGKVRRYRANRASKVYVHGMHRDGELTLLHTYPPKVPQTQARQSNG